MSCKCGQTQKRSESRLSNGKREILLECGTCYRFEKSVITRSGSLVSWKQGVLQPSGVNRNGESSILGNSTGTAVVINCVRNKSEAADNAGIELER